MFQLEDSDFNAELDRLMEVSDIVTSAPQAVIWGGEHSVTYGGLSLVSRIAKRVYVGIEGKIGIEKTEPGKPVVKSAAFDPVTGDFDPGNSDRLVAYERLGKHLGPILKKDNLPYGVRGAVDKLPGAVRILSETPPGRGANFSGSCATALSLAILLLNGVDVGIGPDKNLNWGGFIERITRKNNEGFGKVFWLAMVLETLAHDQPSGYGPYFGLLQSSQEPFLFSPVKRSEAQGGGLEKREETGLEKAEPEREVDITVKAVRGAPWLTGSPLQDPKSDLAVLVVDSGVPKSTAESIHDVGAREGEVQDLIAKEFAPQEASGGSETPLLKQTLESPGPGYQALDGISIHLVVSLKNYCKEPNEERLQTFLKAVRAMDNIHGVVGLHWPKYDLIRGELYAKYGVDVATKLTGGGTGGDFVIFTKKELRSSIREKLETIEPDTGVVYDSIEIGDPISEGVRMEKRSEADKMYFPPVDLAVMKPGPVTDWGERRTEDDLGKKGVEGPNKYSEVLKTIFQLDSADFEGVIWADEVDKKISVYEITDDGFDPQALPDGLSQKVLSRLFKAFAEERQLPVRLSERDILQGLSYSSFKTDVVSRLNGMLEGEASVISHKSDATWKDPWKLDLPQSWAVIVTVETGREEYGS